METYILLVIATLLFFILNSLRQIERRQAAFDESLLSLSRSLGVKSRLFLHPFDKQFRLFAAPLLQCLNRRLMLQSALRNEVVVG